MVYFGSKQGEVKWDEVNKLVVVKYKGFAQSEQLRELLEKGLELLIFREGHRWLEDTIEYVTLSKDDEEWTNNDWLPRAIKGGLKRMAILVPANLVQKNVVDRIPNKAVDAESILIGRFSNIDVALNWVKS